MLVADVSDLKKLADRLEASSLRAANRQAMLADAGYMMMSRFTPRRFDQGGGGAASLVLSGQAGWRPKGPLALPGKLLVVSTRLRRSQGYVVEGDQMTTGTAVPYGGTHNRGMTIRAKNAQHLAIPLPSLSRDEYRRRPSSFENTFVRKNARGRIVMYQRVGRDVRPLFLLLSAVTIPKREWLSFGDMALDTIAGRSVAYVLEGDFPTPAGLKPLSGGTFDVGPQVSA